MGQYQLPCTTFPENTKGIRAGGVAAIASELLLGREEGRLVADEVCITSKFHRSITESGVRQIDERAALNRTHTTVCGRARKPAIRQRDVLTVLQLPPNGTSWDLVSNQRLHIETVGMAALDVDPETVRVDSMVE